MELLKKIKLFYFKKRLNKDLNGYQRQRRLPQGAKTIGIVFDASMIENREAVSQLADGFRQAGKKVRLLGFFNDKHPHEGAPYPYFNQKELVWYDAPKGNLAVIDDFVKQPFDMLYALYFEEVWALDYIVANSKANFKTGVVSIFHEDMDLGVDMNGKKDIRVLLQQIKFYLNRINKKHESLVEV